MTVYSTINISGTSVVEIYDYQLIKSYSDNNAASSFTAQIDNFQGANTFDYGIGQEVTIYAGSDASNLTKYFTGILEDVQFKGSPNDEKIELSGRDYTARLMDRTVEPEVYTNLLAGSIVKDIITKYTNDISVSGVEDSTSSIDRISFKHKPVYDAIKQLAQLSDYTFYIDNDKDLHFAPAGSVDSGITFNSGNVIEADFKEQRDTIFNQIWVYGDRYLDGYQETFTAGSPLGGSIFTLKYNPHNTEVTVSGATIQPGAIAGITNTPVSGAKYLVNFDDKQIVFVSGTLLGANIPASGNEVFINYKRSLPIVKVGDNEPSKATYGTRVKVIVDKDIKDPATAQQLLEKEMSQNSDPRKEGTLKVQGLYNLVPGETCTVDLPFHNVYNKTYDITEVTYDFNKSNNLAEELMTVKVNRKINDITDVLKDTILNLRKIQVGDISDSDVITRFQYTAGSLGLRQSGCFVYTVDSLGSSFILGKGYHGVTNATYGGILGSIVASGINFLGDSRSAYVVNYSGCYPGASPPEGSGASYQFTIEVAPGGQLGIGLLAGVGPGTPYSFTLNVSPGGLLENGLLN